MSDSITVSPNMSAAREAILKRVRSALGPITDTENDYNAIPRAYTRAGVLDAAARLDLFEERLLEYDGGVYRVQVGELASTIAHVLALRGKRRIAIPRGLPPSWLPDGFSFETADDLSAAELDTFDGILTGCTVAIALTGSIVLQNAAAQGPRKLSLVPDYHLCILYADQIVETVSEAMDRLAPTAALPTTFISGPSATADIEMTRVKGVHGPRFLDAILVI